MFINSLGLLDEVPIDKKGSPIDTLSNYLSKKLAFGKLHVFQKSIDIISN